MTTTFYDSHLDTLVKLKALAEKHGMKIRFGTTNQSLNGTSAQALEMFDVGQEFIDLLDEHNHLLIYDRIDALTETLWFELYDPRPSEKHGYYSVMSYENNQVYFTLRNDWQDSIDQIIDEISQEYVDEDENNCDQRIENLEKFKKWLSEKSSDYGGFISFNNAPTKIRGFGKDKIQDGRCYRDGMALHFFTELVCGYLKEPMIHNTY